MIRRILSDFRDRSAHVSAQQRRGGWWRITILAISGALANIETVQRAGLTFLGLPGSLSQTLFAVAALAYSVHVMGAVDTATAPGFGGSTTSYYRYPRSIRTLAKLAFLLLLVIIPLKVMAAVSELTPMPSRFFGFVFDARTADPVAGA